MAWQVGGDGLVHELVSGMLQRPDHLRLPVGVLPAGRWACATLLCCLFAIVLLKLNV